MGRKVLFGLSDSFAFTNQTNFRNQDNSRLVVAALSSCTNAVFEKSESSKRTFFAIYN
jgi:hypothetical protein